MFGDLLRQLLAPAPHRLPEPDARLALAALLVRVARSDGLYAAEEVERIDRVLAHRHGRLREETGLLNKLAGLPAEPQPT